MLEKLIRFSVQNRTAVLAVTAALVVLGWISFKNLNIDAVPDITNNQVQVNTATKGLTPEEIERYVTVPVESSMGGLAGLIQTRSVSRFGLSQVTLIFEDDVDIYRARQMVSERLQEAASDLPAGYQPKLGPMTTGLGEVVFYTVHASTPAADGPERIRQLMELDSYHEWEIERRLLTVQGVAEISSVGGYRKQFHVQPTIQLMARYGIHFSDILEALEKTNENVGGGYVEQTAEQFLVQATGLLRSIPDIQAVPVRTLETYKTITVGDVAEVRLDSGLRAGAALVNGREEVLGTVLMRLGENSRKVAHAVRARLDEMKKTLPAGMELDILYDRADVVDATLKTVQHNLLLGAILVIVILVALLGNIRAALITAVTIPVTLLVTFILMRYWGISGNLMSLGALDFGIIIDGIVIVIDNCVRRLHARRDELGRALSRAEVQETVTHATLEIRQSAGFGQFIIVVVFIPIFALTGVEGKMFRPMASAFSIAVAIAFVLSFTLAPALASLALASGAADIEPWIMRKIRQGYSRFLAWTLDCRKWVLAAGILAIAAGVILFTRLGGEFLPQLNEGSILIQCIRPSTISLGQSIALQSLTEKVILRFPQVTHVFGRMGTSEAAVDVMGINISDTFIGLKDPKDWAPINGRRPNKYELAEAIREQLAREVPGQSLALSQPIQMRFNEILEGIRADVSVKIFGDDMDTLVELAERTQEAIRKVRGAGDVELEIQGKSPLLHIQPRNKLLKDLGVSNREVLETVGSAVGGAEAGAIYEGFRRFPIVVRLKERERENLAELAKLPVGIGANTTVPLGDAATLHFEDTYGTISREQGKRRVAIMINPRGRDTESFVGEAQREVRNTVKLPEGYYMEWGGNFQNLQQAKARLLVLAPIVLFLVLFIIYAAFRNVTLTLLVFSGVPLALVGGVLGLMVMGLPFSISAGVGFVALSGIAVLNGVVLVNCFNDLHNAGLRGRELIMEGTALRIRPVLMTALVEIFGFLPMMLATGLGAEVQRPLAAVVIGGVLSSTFLTLVVLPTLYSLLSPRWEKEEAEL